MIRFFLISLFILVCMGCRNLHHLPADDFQRNIEQAQMQSFYWTEYIGQAGGKAYVVRARAPLFGKKWKEEIFSTDIDELDPAFLGQLEMTKRTRELNEPLELIKTLEPGTTPWLNL